MNPFVLQIVVVLCCLCVETHGSFLYNVFNETTGLVFVGSAATTSCINDTLRNYGDVHGDADRFNEDVIKERGETTDSVFESTVETHQQEYNKEIEESQAGFLHRPGTLSAPTRCSVRVRLTPSGPSKAGAVWYREEVPVSTGFDTYFTFQMTDHSKECSLHKDQYFTQISYRSCSVHGGDGFAFVIHNAEESRLDTSQYPIGTNGGQMGFGGIPNSLAIAFDTWQNPGEDTMGVDHVSVQSMGQGENDALEKGLLGVPRAVDLADGAVHLARVKYFPQLMPQYVIIRELIWVMFRELLLYTAFESLESPDLLLPYSVITLALHNTIILIITHKSTNPLQVFRQACGL